MTVDSTDVHTYWYDHLYQLTDVQYPDMNTATYNYDSLGNRTSVVNSGTTSYLSNELNQYDSVGGISFTYDDNGNLTSDGINGYVYDSQNRLVSATTPSHTASYTYDHSNRRITKTVDGVITKYVYDGDQVIAEYDANDNLLRKFIYGPGIDESIAMIATGSTYFYLFDGLGSVTALSDVNGNLVESYSYDVFGQSTTNSAVGNPYLFTGRRYDSESHLYYYRSRYYSPGIGRFLETDPTGYFDSLNLYTYVNNNPLNWIDPYGLCKTEENEKLIDILKGTTKDLLMLVLEERLVKRGLKSGLEQGIPLSKNFELIEDWKLYKEFEKFGSVLSWLSYGKGTRDAWRVYLGTAKEFIRGEKSQLDLVHDSALLVSQVVSVPIRGNPFYEFKLKDLATLTDIASKRLGEYIYGNPDAAYQPPQSKYPNPELSVL
jgi:RHS repeat-associated protein